MLSGSGGALYSAEVRKVFKILKIIKMIIMKYNISGGALYSAKEGGKKIFHNVETDNIHLKVEPNTIPLKIDFHHLS